ncbi:MAG: hypothetical protein KKF56_05340 [Nanoarchaeota archaeon]|nr:hypothetical protein [Nanoarchaeota archaeon]
MKNKASAGVIFVIIVIVIFIGLIITGIVIGNKKGWFNGDEPINPSLIKMYLMARDMNTKETQTANYVLDYNRNPAVIISQGELTKDWNEVIVPNNQLYHLWCWNENHYVIKASKMFTLQELTSNISKHTCDMVKIGDISIVHYGDLSRKENLITFNITTKDYFKKLSACFEWSAGIVSVHAKNQNVLCEKGNWVNWSFYNATDETYNYLPKDMWRCGECEDVYCEQTEKCELVEGRYCKIKNIEVPNRYRGLVDSCYYFGKSLNNETFTIELEVETLDNKNILDFIKIYFFDKDRRYNPVEGMWTYQSELNGENLGNPKDFEYRIDYYNEN